MKPNFEFDIEDIEEQVELLILFNKNFRKQISEEKRKSLYQTLLNIKKDKILYKIENRKYLMI